MKIKKVRALVTCALPEDVTAEDFITYVRDAVECWCGSLEAPTFHSEGDPLFNIRESIEDVSLYNVTTD